MKFNEAILELQKDRDKVFEGEDNLVQMSIYKRRLQFSREIFVEELDTFIEQEWKELTPKPKDEIVINLLEEFDYNVNNLVAELGESFRVNYQLP